MAMSMLASKCPVPSASFDHDIRSDLSTLDDDLYDAVGMDEFSLRGLVARLSDLNKRVSSTQAVSKGLVKPKTVSLIQSISSRARILASNMINVHRSTEEIASKRESQIADVLARMSINADTRATRNSPTTRGNRGVSRVASNGSNESTSTVTGVEDAEPLLHTTQSLEWLLKNLHNPYPSNVKKAKIAVSSHASLKTVNSTFVSLRSRIGWTKISKHYFNGNRALAIDCAHRVFLEDPPSAVPDQIRRELLDMEATAEGIYRRMTKGREAVKEIDRVIGNVVAMDKVGVPSETQPEKTIRNGSVPHTDEYLPAVAELHVVHHERSASAPPTPVPGNEEEQVSPLLSTDEHCLTETITPSPLETPSEGLPAPRPKALHLSPMSPPPGKSPKRRLSYTGSDDGTPEAKRLHLFLDMNSGKNDAQTLSYVLPPRKRRLSQTDSYAPSIGERPCKLMAISPVQTSPTPLSTTRDPLAVTGFPELEQTWSGFDLSIPNCVTLGEQVSGELELQSLSYPYDPLASDPSAVMNLSIMGGLGFEGFEMPNTIDCTFPGANSGTESLLEGFCGLPAFPELSFDYDEVPSPSTESYSVSSGSFSSPSGSVRSMPGTDLPSPDPVFVSAFDSPQPSLLDFILPPELQVDSSLWCGMAKIRDPISTDPVQGSLEAGREVKLERLKRLKEEKQRLAEEELRLEQDLCLSQT